LDGHVGLDSEGIDRLYLNLYQPRLQTGGGVVAFFTKLNVRLLRPGLSQLFDGCPKAANRPLADAAKRLDTAFDDLIAEAKLAA
jgi:hypothetical protein